MNITDISIEKKWFIVFFIIGLFGIPSLKYIGTPQFFTTGFACMLIMIYAWVLLKNKKNYCGDNVYYMGFLFTLISLTSALYNFNTNDAISSIISNFSIALGSTIVGFFLRILFVQYDENTVDKIETQKRQELNEAAEKLTYAMRASIQEFNDYAESFGATRRSAEQAMLDGMEETKARVIALLSEIASQYSDMSAAQKKQLEAFDEAAKKMFTMDTPSDVLAKKLDPAIQEIALLMDTLKKKRQAEDRAAKKTDANLEKFNTNLEQCASKLEKTNENMDGFITDMGLLRDTAKEISELKDSMITQVETQNSLNETHLHYMQKSVEQMNELNQTAEHSSEQLLRSIDLIKTENTAHSEKLKEYEEFTNRFLSMDSPSELLEKGLAKFFEQINLLTSSIEQKRLAEEEASHTTNTRVKALNENMATLANALHTASGQLGEMAGDLSALKSTAQEISSLKERMTQQVEAQTSLNERYTALHAKNIDTISQQNKTYQGTIEDAQNAMQKMTDSMQDISAKLLSTVDRLQGSIEEINNTETQSQKMMQESVQETLSAARNVNLVLGQMVEHTTMQLRKDA